MNLTTAFLFIIVALILLMVIQEVRHQEERKDLTDRLMAKDFGEYKSLSKPRASGPPRNFLIRNMKDGIDKLEREQQSS